MKRGTWLVGLSSLVYCLVHAGPVIPRSGLGVEVAPEVVIASVLRLAATAIAGYLLIIVVLDTVSHMRPFGWLTVAIAHITPRAIRQLMGLTLSVSALTSASIAPAMAARAHVVGLPQEIRDAPIMHQLDGPTATSTSPLASATDAAGAAIPEAGVSAPEVATSTPSSWIVKPGDSFWVIAESLAPHEVDSTWRRLIAANRDRLVDRDNPDLLLPGQTLVVPVSSGS